MDRTVPVDTPDTFPIGLRAIEQDVAALLDVEAGLRDILLPIRYDDLAGALADLVDIRAGLADLVGTDVVDVA
ncbi:hypothetical protein [Micromonospora sagamiensis]|uniref:Uncharacterized protein n=1 Tax=Micromonospora sagamiensis TaxID=47875 RepID=A0A562WFV9_9ACTN|nr:hypothetical protein [Micromonospora sagamiensis]TWJ29106.1 hypothetical protein JD81_02612 [Micromonospora sagamiensis]BCL17869.1 hypothetical protein GCM10017556_56080 [Micromonospora sagamiensis]